MSKIKQVLNILFPKKTVEEVKVIEEPVIEVKPPEKVVQEPFISLVKTFEENPRRFKVTVYNAFGECALVDKELNNIFTVTRRFCHDGSYGRVEYTDISVNGTPFYSYTDTDIHYVYNKLYNYYTARCEKYNKLTQQKLHNRLMKGYVK